MPGRSWWMIKPVAVGIIAILLICYVFSVALSIGSRQARMLMELGKLGDHSFDYALGAGDILWLAAIGSLIALFAGGMAATLLARFDVKSPYDRLMPSVIVAVLVFGVIDAYMFTTWCNSIGMHADPYGRPVDPSPFIVILFLMLAVDAACLVASILGGAIVWVPEFTRKPGA